MAEPRLSEHVAEPWAEHVAESVVVAAEQQQRQQQLPKQVWIDVGLLLSEQRLVDRLLQLQQQQLQHAAAHYYTVAAMLRFEPAEVVVVAAVAETLQLLLSAESLLSEQWAGRLPFEGFEVAAIVTEQFALQLLNGD